MDKKPENPITFEGEGDVHEEIKKLVTEFNTVAGGEEAVSSYITGFNSMFAYFDDLYKKNVKLLEYCQDMNTTIVMHASKIKALLEITQQDKGTLGKLKSDFDEASKMVLFAHSSENKAKDLLTSLRTRVSQLSEQVQRGEAFSFGEEGSIFEISQDVKNLTMERDKAAKDIHDSESQYSQMKSYFSNLTEELKILSDEKERLNQQIIQSDKIIADLDNMNSENFNYVMELKPQIMNQKVEIDNLCKSKKEETKNKKILKANQYDILSNLGQLRDEQRSFKDKIMRRSRYAAELKSSANNKELNAQDINRKIELRTELIGQLEQDVKKVMREGEDLSVRFEELRKEAEVIADQKAATRKVTRNLRSDLVDIQFKLAKSDNETQQHARHVTATKIDLGIQKTVKVEATKETADVADKSKSVRQETKALKHSLQQKKEKILVLFREIDEKRSERFQMEAKIQMTRDSIKVTNEQHIQHIQVLDDFKRKAIDQALLTDKLRAERNNYKRQFEAMKEELIEIQTQYDQLMNEIKMLEEKNCSVVDNTIDMHFQNIGTKNEISSLKLLIEKSMKGIQETERTISRLQAEGQTLNHILDEAKHDRLLQEKEHQLLENNIAIIRQEVTVKLKKLDEIRSQIQTDEAFIRKCSKLYYEKADEIRTVMSELTQHEKKTHELEQRKERINALEYEMHRTFTQEMIEKQKCVALIHEFSIQRNVHRWHALEAVDPGYVKNLRYRSILSGNFDAAHRELLDLLKVKEEKKAVLEKLKADKESQLKKIQVEAYIQKYAEDIQKKDIEIRQYKSLLNGNKDEVRQSVQTIESIRERVSQKRESTATLRSRTNTKKLAMLQESNIPYYLTEAPVTNFRGGGFLEKPPEEIPVQDSEDIIMNDLKIIAATPTSDRRAKSSLLSQNMKRLTKPIRPSQLRSPTRITNSIH